MSKRTLFAVSLIMILLVPAALFAQKGHMEKKHKEMICMEMCSMEMSCKHGEKGLDLEPAQKLAIEKLKLELKLANIDIKAEQKKLKMKIKEELLKEEVSRKTIDKYMKNIAANHEKMQKNRLDHAFEIKKLLGPEQWKMFIAHHWNRMGGDHSCSERGAKRCGHGGMRCSMGKGMMGGCGMSPHMEGKGSGGECPMGKDKAE